MRLLKTKIPRNGRRRNAACGLGCIMQLLFLPIYILIRLIQKSGGKR
jgi:hypothetical protein